METKWIKWYAMTSHVIAYRSLELLFGTHTFHFNCFFEDFNCVFTRIRCLSRVLFIMHLVQCVNACNIYHDLAGKKCECTQICRHKKNFFFMKKNLLLASKQVPNLLPVCLTIIFFFGDTIFEAVHVIDFGTYRICIKSCIH